MDKTPEQISVQQSVEKMQTRVAAQQKAANVGATSRARPQVAANPFATELRANAQRALDTNPHRRRGR